LAKKLFFLAFRVLLKLLAANPSSGFTQFIYGITAPLAVPFLGVITSSTVRRSVLEWSTLLAMIVYLVVAYGIAKLIQFIKPATPEEVERTIDTEV